jgi:hypothetical protein
MTSHHLRSQQARGATASLFAWSTILVYILAAARPFARPRTASPAQKAATSATSTPTPGQRGADPGIPPLTFPQKNNSPADQQQ